MLRRIRNLLANVRETVKRILLGLMFLVAVVLTTIVLLAPGEISEFIEGISIFIRIAVLLVVYAIAAFITYQEFFDDDESELDGLIVKGGPGSVITVLDRESAQKHILAAVNKIDGVEQATLDLQVVKGKALIDLKVNVRDAVSLPDKQREVIKSLEKVVQRQLGVKFADRPRVSIAFADAAAAAPVPPVEEVMPDKTEPVNPAQRRFGRSKPEQPKEPSPVTEVTPVPSAKPETPEVKEAETVAERTPEPKPKTEPVIKDDAPPADASSVEENADGETADGTDDEDGEFYSFLKSTYSEDDENAPKNPQ